MWLCYYFLMDELTIKQTQDVLGMSYPTALAYAQQNGRISLTERRWVIPAHVVWDELQKRRADIDERESQLKHYCLNFHPSHKTAVNGTAVPPG